MGSVTGPVAADGMRPSSPAGPTEVSASSPAPASVPSGLSRRRTSLRSAAPVETQPIRVVGAGHPSQDCFVEGATVFAGRRHIVAWSLPNAREIDGDMSAFLQAVAAARALGPVTVVASGDPGFFGITRLLAERFGRTALEVHPMPSAVSLAWAAVGLPWDDCIVISLHGRPAVNVVYLALQQGKAAILTAPDCPPSCLAAAVRRTDLTVSVCVRLGTEDEEVVTGGADILVREWDDPNVVLLWRGQGVAAKGRTWGLPCSAYAHRASMITKPEVRAMALAGLSPWPGAILWDVGGGSGAVAVEAARLGAVVYTVEREADDCAHIRENIAIHLGEDAPVTLVQGEAPDALEGLPPPDLVFLGGGGPEVAAVVAARRPVRVVLTLARIDLLAAMEAALHEYSVEASLLSVSRVRALAGGYRLEAENPVLLLIAVLCDQGEIASPGPSGKVFL